MKYKHFLCSSIVALSVTGLCSVVNVDAANDAKDSKADQHQSGDTTTTKSKLESQKMGEGKAAFKDLNKNVPKGTETVPDMKGPNKSGGAESGSGSGNTGASGGSGSGGGSGGGGS